MALQDIAANTPIIGIDLDTKEENIKQGDYKYALNMVLEDNDNIFVLSNEQYFNPSSIGLYGDEEIIGICNIKNDEYLIITAYFDSQGDNIWINRFFKAKIGENVELELIGQLLDGYTDKNSFQCALKLKNDERIVYATNGVDKPIYIRVDNIDRQKNGLYLSKELLTIDLEFDFPQIDLSVSNGGSLYPGSYAIAIKYFDEELNETNWIITTNPVRIKPVEDTLSSARHFGQKAITTDSSDKTVLGKNITNKAINVTVSLTDRVKSSYKYYKLGVIVSYNGSSKWDSAYETKLIPISTLSHRIENIELLDSIDISEILFNKLSFESAKAVAYYENRLVFGNLKYNNTVFKSFQKYASRIASRVITKIYDIEDPKESAKSSVVVTGFIPGEVYAFGIVYIMEDGSLSPVFHIPAPLDSSSGFTPYYLNSLYENNEQDAIDFWGSDSSGTQLAGSAVRIHQFPFRDKIDYSLYPEVSGNTIVKFNYSKVDGAGLDINTITVKDGSGNVLATLDVAGGSNVDITTTVRTGTYKEPETGEFITYTETIYNISAVINGQYDNLQFEYLLSDSNTYDDTTIQNIQCYFINPLLSTCADNSHIINFSRDYYIESADPGDVTMKLGVEFSNIDLPEGAKGFIIVRDKKEEYNRNILDKGYAFYAKVDPNSNSFIYSFMNNISQDSNDFKYDVLFLKTPKILYDRRPLKGNLYVEGTVNLLRETPSYDTNYGVYKVTPDSNETKGIFTGIFGDFKAINAAFQIVRTKPSQYKVSSDVLHGTLAGINDIYYLLHTGEPRIVYNNVNYNVRNVSLDDQVAVVILDRELRQSSGWEIPNKNVLFYVSIVNPAIIYESLSDITYIPVTYVSQATKTGNTVQTYNGDNYISELRFGSSIYYDIFNENVEDMFKSATKIIGQIGTAFLGAAEAVVGAALGQPELVISGGVTFLKSEFGMLLDGFNRIYGLFTKPETNSIRNAAVHVWAPYLTKDSNGALVDETGFFDKVFADSNSVLGIAPGAVKAMIYQLDFYINLLVDSPYNNYLRIIQQDQSSMFLGNEFEELLEYAKGKYLVFDKEREGDFKLTIKYIPFPNVYEFNNSYLVENNLKAFFSLTWQDTYNLKDNFKNRLIWSKESENEATNDTNRTFLANNYRDITNTNGEIVALKPFNRRLYVFTTDSLYFYPKPMQEKITDEMQLYVGTGMFLGVGPFRVSDDDTSILGTIWPESIIIAQDSIFYVNNVGHILMIGGRGFDNLSLKKMITFFNDSNIRIIHMLTDSYKSAYNDYYGEPYTINNAYHSRGVGYLIGYDPVNMRVLLTQKDYNSSSSNGLSSIGYTLSFSLLTNRWLSFHDYIPDAYLSNAKYFGHIKDKNINILSDNKFKGNFEIDLIAVKDQIQDRIWEDLRLNIMIRDERNMPTFDRFLTSVIFYNNEQVSTEKNFVIRREEQNFLLNAITNNSDEIYIRNEEWWWNINDIKDYRTDYDGSIIYKGGEKFRFREIIPGNNTKHWADVTQMRGLFLGIRLKSKKGEPIYDRYSINPYITISTKSIS